MENESNTNAHEAGAKESGEDGGEVLVVASKLKAYIRSKSGMNTSTAVMDAVSRKLRMMCDQAIEHAKSEGRKTVMDRDFPV
jgi:histone H3/H4